MVDVHKFVLTTISQIILHNDYSLMSLSLNIFGEPSALHFHFQRASSLLFSDKIADY